MRGGRFGSFARNQSVRTDRDRLRSRTGDGRLAAVGCLQDARLQERSGGSPRGHGHRAHWPIGASALESVWLERVNGENKRRKERPRMTQTQTEASRVFTRAPPGIELQIRQPVEKEIGRLTLGVALVLRRWLAGDNSDHGCFTEAGGDDRRDRVDEFRERGLWIGAIRTLGKWSNRDARHGSRHRTRGVGVQCPCDPWGSRKGEFPFLSWWSVSSVWPWPEPSVWRIHRRVGALGRS